MNFTRHERQLPHGFNAMTSKDSDMMMDIGVQVMNAGEEQSYEDAAQETAFVIMTGSVQISWNGQTETMKRTSLFEECPYCLHVPAGVKVAIKAEAASEVLIQKTPNDKEFAPVFYKPEDVQADIFGGGVWGGTSTRTVRTIFDHSNAPYSNMVNGEVINAPGRWSSYTPHHHPQPEVYVYKFDREQGFGCSFIGDNAFKITNNSVSEITDGNVHPQVTAPGYAMWYSWMIRHLDGNPWEKTRTNDVEHEWLNEAGADEKIWEPK